MLQILSFHRVYGCINQLRVSCFSLQHRSIAVSTHLTFDQRAGRQIARRERLKLMVRTLRMQSTPG